MAALLLLGSSSLLAGTWYTADSSVNLGTRGYGVSALEACQDKWGAGSVTYIAYDNPAFSYQPGYCWISGSPGGAIYVDNSTCPTQLPHEWSDGFCHAEEACPLGDFQYRKQTFDSVNQLVNSSLATSIEIDDCSYSIYKVIGVGNNGDGTYAATDLYISTGEFGESSLISVVPDNSSSNSADMTIPNSTSQEPSTVSTTNIPELEETLPDGRVLTTSSTTTVTNFGGTGTITNGVDTVTITSTSGSNTSEVISTTVTKFSDGSQTIEEVTTTSTSHPQTTVNTRIVQGSSISRGEASTGSTTTTIRTEIDADGNITQVDGSTQKTGSDAGTGDGDPTKEGNCGAPDQPPCDVVLAGENNLVDPDKLIEQSGVNDTRDNNINDLKSGGIENEGSLFSLSNVFASQIGGVLGSNSCDPDFATYDVFGQTFKPFLAFCPMYDTHIRPFLKWVLYMLTLFSIYSIYLKTMRDS